MAREVFDEAIYVVEDEGGGIHYTPFIDDAHGICGFKATIAGTDETEYAYLCPSSNEPGSPEAAEPNVFIYVGPHADPSRDEALHFFLIHGAGIPSAGRPRPMPDRHLVRVEFDWSDEHGDCFDCGLPAAYRIPRFTHNTMPDTDIFCSICAAGYASRGFEIRRLFPEE